MKRGTTIEAPALPEKPKDPAISRALRWMVVISILVHVVAAIVLRPWARSEMVFNRTEEQARTDQVRQREKARKALEGSQRAKRRIPSKHRDQLKKQAERKQRTTMQRRVERMKRDRDAALRQRKRALDELRKRDKLDVIRRKVTPRLLKSKAIAKLDNQAKDFINSQAQLKKTDKDKRDDAKVRGIAAQIKKAVESLEKEPENVKKHLKTIGREATKLRSMMHALKPPERHRHRLSRNLLDTAYAIHKDLNKAKAQMREVDALHDVPKTESTAKSKKVDPGKSDKASEAGKEDSNKQAEAKNGANKTQENASAKPSSQSKDSTKASQAKKGAESSSTTQTAKADTPRANDRSRQSAQRSDSKKVSQSGQKQVASKQEKQSTSQRAGAKTASSRESRSKPSPAELYRKAKALEQEVAAIVNDARAAQLAKLHDLSFKTARKRMNSYKPARPDLGQQLQSNQAQTVGALNQYRKALQQAGAQIESMALRTKSMTQGVSRVARNGGRAGKTARGRGFSDMTGGSAGEGGEAGGGDSHGLRKGESGFERGRIRGRSTSQIRLPKKMIKAEALPGRKLTDRSTRKGWLYVDTWYVIGPWPVSYVDKFAKVYPPEYEIDFDATYTNGKFSKQPDHEAHKMRWQFVQSDEIRISPPKVYGGETWYAYTEVYSDKKRDMLLAVATDDFAKVWLNDKVVWEDRRESPWNMGEAFRRVTFKKGFNRILFRVGNGPEYCIWSVLLCPPEVMTQMNLGGKR